MRLGVWQLERMQQRRALNAALARRIAMAPLTGLPDAAADSVRYRRVTLSGVFDFERQLVVAGRSLRGVPGAHVVTPLVLPSGVGVLVERGWVPTPDGTTVDLAALGEPDSATVEGLLLLSPEAGAPLPRSAWPLTVRYPDPAWLAPVYPYPLFALVLRRTGGGGAGLVAVAAPRLAAGPHLSYAIQWFAFAAIAVVGSLVWSRKRASPEGAAR